MYKWHVSDIDLNVEYLLNPTNRTFWAAQSFCAQNGGTIVRADNNVVQSYIHRKYLKRGLEDVWVNAQQTSINSGKFRWLDDNSIVTNINWQIGQPDNLQQACDALELHYPGNNWYDWGCENSLAVLCQRKILLDFHTGGSPIEQLGRFVNQQFINLTNQIAHKQDAFHDRLTTQLANLLAMSRSKMSGDLNGIRNEIGLHNNVSICIGIALLMLISACFWLYGISVRQINLLRR